MAALAAAILTAGVSFADEQVLYWMVDDSAMINVDGTDVSIKDYLDPSKPNSSSPYIVAPETYYAARIHVTGGGGEDTFLPLYYPGGGLEDGTFGVELWENAGVWGAGVPTGNQSPVTGYASGSPEYTFIVEIGNVSWDEGSGVASWVETVAESAAASYSSLYEAGYIASSFDTNPPSGQIWTQTSFTAVPEPSSGLLLLVGGGLLLLRRRRADVTQS